MLWIVLIESVAIFESLTTGNRRVRRCCLRLLKLLALNMVNLYVHLLVLRLNHLANCRRVKLVVHSHLLLLVRVVLSTLNDHALNESINAIALIHNLLSVLRGIPLRLSTHCSCHALSNGALLGALFGASLVLHV
jgi:hypothetical protein